MPKWKI